MSTELIARTKQSIIDGDEAAAVQVSREALEAGLSASDIRRAPAG